MADTGIITEIKRFATHDGPGIRTAVFLKGCPLGCRWCSNPETISREIQLYFIPNRCKNSLACIDVCPEKIITPGVVNKIARNSCTYCMKCVDTCLYGAYQQVGKEYSVDEIVHEIKKDLPFYGKDGGVTLSGGEPLYQPDFSVSVLKKCRENGLSTVLDTSGFAAREVIDEAIKYTDLVLYDIKHMDTEKHKQGTGQGNEMILENLKRISARTSVRISLPLIPGFNDDEKNITETASFAQSLNIGYIDINPFHSLGACKFMYLGLDSPYGDYKPVTKENVIRTKKIIEQFKIKTTIGRMM